MVVYYIFVAHNEHDSINCCNFLDPGLPVTSISLSITIDQRTVIFEHPLSLLLDRCVYGLSLIFVFAPASSTVIRPKGSILSGHKAWSNCTTIYLISFYVCLLRFFHISLYSSNLTSKLQALGTALSESLQPFGLSLHHHLWGNPTPSIQIDPVLVPVQPYRGAKNQ